jgi:hypothetical protein
MAKATRAVRVAILDADIARGAAESQAAAAGESVAVLRAVKDQGVRVAFDASLATEWDAHASDFARRWRFSMVSADRVVFAGACPSAATALAFLESARLPAAELAARSKDAHLLGLALDLGAPIASRDRRSRNGFQSLCARRPPWAQVRWALIPDALDDFVAWCAHGAALPPMCP